MTRLAKVAALDRINKYKEFIKNNDFTGFYRKVNSITAPRDCDKVGAITQIFYEAGILDDVLENLDYIPENMFYEVSIENLNIPSNIKEIESSAFAYSKLKEITLPESIKSIGTAAFMGCQQLTEIKIPESVGISDMRYVFWACTGLETLWLPIKWRGNYRRNVIFGKWSPIPTTVKYY